MTLAETAFHTRRIIKYGGILIVALLFLKIAWEGGYRAFRFFFPAPPPAPQIEFGKLPALVFEPRGGTQQLKYTLQTPTGELPQLPTIATVYFMPTPQSSFLNLDEATKIAKGVGFSGTPSALSEVIYRFPHPEIPATLDINIVNKTLSLSYNLSQDPELLTQRPRSDDDALRSARAFLSSAGLLTPDIEGGTQTLEYLKTGDQTLQTVSSLSEANFVRVNFFRKDVGGFQVLTPRKDRGNVWLLASGETFGQKQIIAGEYHYFPVAEEQNSTYPIKTADVAWQEIQAGKGLVISPPASGADVVVRRVYLAYYDSGQPQQFLQPVIVFDGDKGFRAIVPAVIAEWYGG